jgi:hypothetical protein
MIQLLHYQLSLHVRLISTYVMLGLIGVAYSMNLESPINELRSVAAITNSSFILVWVTLTFMLQLTAIHHFFFRPEALQYRLARIRNRAMILSASFIHILILAIIASVPFAVIYFGLLDTRIALLSWMNMVVFYVFLGMATSLIIRFIGSGTLTSVLALLLLFLVPVGLNGLSSVAPALADQPVVQGIITLMQSHLNVASNTDMLILRGIQDTNALLRTLILIPILATITYVHFLRGDHH